MKWSFFILVSYNFSATKIMAYLKLHEDCTFYCCIGACCKVALIQLYIANQIHPDFYKNIMGT